MNVPSHRAVLKLRHRLQTPAQFRKLYRTGERGRTRYFAWRTCANELPHPRLGLVVAKKHLRRAVDRNLVRRLIRESFRCRTGAMPCVDVLVLLMAEPDLQDRRALTADLNRLWYEVNRAATRNEYRNSNHGAGDAAAN